MLCAVIAARTADEVRASLVRARDGGADLAEVRADFLATPDIEILRHRPLPVILTVRPRREGGEFVGSEASRRAVLRRGAELGVEYLDIEARGFQPIPGPRIIVSYHDFEGVTGDPLAMRMSGAFCVKWAVTPRSTRELVELATLQKRFGSSVAVVPMGPYGEPLRACYSMWGAPIMYASLEASTAPGQISLREHREVYRTHEIGPGTKLLAVFGDPIAHSRSPQRHNPGLAALGARMVRVRLDRAEDLRATMEGLGIVAAAVTAPHKQAVIPGRTVNTVWIEAGALRGASTDLDGARAAIAGSEGPAMVYGAGGAARAFVQALREAGRDVSIVNRSRERAERLAAEFGARVGETAARTIVNATSVGMNEDVSAVPPERLGPGVTVIESVYTPRETRLVREARSRGARVVDGTVMFEAQAAAQFEIFRRVLEKKAAPE